MKSNVSKCSSAQGSHTDLRNSWYKIIYYQKCTALVPDPVTESSCVPFNDIVYNLHVATYLDNNGWTKCYDEEFAQTSATTDLMESCAIGDDHYIFMGAMPNAASPFVYMGAVAPDYVLSDFTSSTTKAAIPFSLEGTEYNVYWYNYYGQSIGFSSSSDISLTEPFGGDTEDKIYGTTQNERLSFSLSPFFGGYRAGIYYDLRNNYEWRKVIFYKKCTESTVIQPDIMDGNCYMNNIVHEWHIRSNLLDKGWERCYFAPYSEPTKSVSDKGCPTGIYNHCIYCLFCDKIIINFT